MRLVSVQIWVTGAQCVTAGFTPRSKLNTHELIFILNNRTDVKSQTSLFIL